MAAPAKSHNHNMDLSQIFRGLAYGIVSGAVGWACCISLVVLGFLGIGTFTAFLSTVHDHYRWILVALSFVCMDVSIYYFLKQYHGSCNLKVIRNNLGQVAFIVLVTLFTYFILQAILPYLLA